MIEINSEHWLLMAGLFLILASLLWTPFFKIGVITCILSYAIDLVKRIKETDLGDVPDILKKQVD